MKKTDVTYGQIDKVLRSLGYSCRVVTKNKPTRVYEREEPDTWIMLPALPKEEPAWDYHLLYVRTTLDLLGIADPTVFDAKLQKAG